MLTITALCVTPVIGLIYYYHAACPAEIIPGVRIDISSSMVVEERGGVLAYVERVDGTDLRPPFLNEFYEASQELFGVPVNLSFEFFNGALVKVHIYPVFDASVDQLRKGVGEMHGVLSSKLKAGVNVGCLRLVEIEGPREEVYISIAVRKVEARVRRWVFQYS